MLNFRLKRTLLTDGSPVFDIILDYGHAHIEIDIAANSETDAQQKAGAVHAALEAAYGAPIKRNY